MAALDSSSKSKICIRDLPTWSRFIPINFAASNSWSSNGAESFSSSASFSCAARDFDAYRNISANRLITARRDLRVSYHRISFASQTLDFSSTKSALIKKFKKAAKKATIPKTAPTSPRSNIVRNRITSNLHHKLPYTSKRRQTQPWYANYFPRASIRY